MAACGSVLQGKINAHIENTAKIHSCMQRITSCSILLHGQTSDITVFNDDLQKEKLNTSFWKDVFVVPVQFGCTSSE